WSGGALDPARRHDVTITTGRVEPGSGPSAVRAALAAADEFGCSELVVGGVSLLRSPVCPGCSAWVPPLPPSAFHTLPPEETGSHRIAGLAPHELLERSA